MATSQTTAEPNNARFDLNRRSTGVPYRRRGAHHQLATAQLRHPTGPSGEADRRGLTSLLPCVQTNQDRS